MSENWDFYLCDVEEHRASIFVDLDLINEAPQAALPYVWSMRVTMRDPRPDGLSTPEEAHVLNELEDAINAELEKSDPAGVPAGRTTWNGIRDHIAYVPSDEGWDQRANLVRAMFPDYEIESAVWEDPEWQTYLGSIYPTEEQLESIENARMCREMEENGDPLEEPRELDHWATFPSAKHRVLFQVAVEDLGYHVRDSTETPAVDDVPATWGIQIYRLDVPTPDAIDNITLPLFQLAREHGGTYDGWESEAVKPASK